mgnify:CR=1 FL=1
MICLDIEYLHEYLPDRLIGSNLFHFGILSSTMDKIREFTDGDYPEGLVVVARDQTDGRGRFDRRWISSSGNSLMFSVLLMPTADQLPYINMAAALSVVKAIEPYTSGKPSIKWPNDIRLRGKKFAGILIETDSTADKLMYAVVGIGVNLDLDVSRYSEISSTATNINSNTDREMDSTTIIGSILTNLDRLYKEVKAGRSLTNQWANYLDTLGQNVLVRRGSTVFQGLARHVDKYGNLTVDLADGTSIVVTGGEVTFQG